VRLFVDYANNHPTHGVTVFDEARVCASRDAKNRIEFINGKHSMDLICFIRSNPESIKITNYAQTSLLEETCTHADFSLQSNLYLEFLVRQEVEIINQSNLTSGVVNIDCRKRYHRTLLSFYLAAIATKSPIVIFKNLYNIVEYFMEKDGQESLEKVLNDKVGAASLAGIIGEIKTMYGPQTLILSVLINGEMISADAQLEPLSESDQELVRLVSKRLYFKRNAALHSKKEHKGKPVQYQVHPGSYHESNGFVLDIELLTKISELIIDRTDLME
jgi:hypothetical protein